MAPNPVSSSRSTSSAIAPPVSASAVAEPISAALSAIAGPQASPPSLVETFLSQYENASKCLEQGDFERTREWLRRALQNNPKSLKEGGCGDKLQKARFMYGKMCIYGEGGPIEKERGLTYLSAASIDKHMGATVEWALHLLTSKPETAKNLLEVAASEGSREARIVLAFLVVEESLKALTLLEEAQNLGHPNPSYALAQLLINHGQKNEAFAWIKKAANQGNANAMYDAAQYVKDINLGSYGKEIMLSAQHGCADAQVEMGMQYAGLDPEDGWLERDYGKARESFLKAAAQHHPGALYGLAVLYQSGNGVDVGFVKARNLYIAAIHAANRWQPGPLLAPPFDLAPVYQALAEMTRAGAGCAADSALALEFHRKFLVLQKI